VDVPLLTPWKRPFSFPALGGGAEGAHEGKRQRREEGGGEAAPMEEAGVSSDATLVDSEEDDTPCTVCMGAEQPKGNAIVLCDGCDDG
jgi:hypothetical protein